MHAKYTTDRFVFWKKFLEFPKKLAPFILLIDSFFEKKFLEFPKKLAPFILLIDSFFEKKFLEFPKKISKKISKKYFLWMFFFKKIEIFENKFSKADLTLVEFPASLVWIIYF
jgi:hypothetical protein